VNGLRLKLFSFSVRGELVEPQKNTFARASGLSKKEYPPFTLCHNQPSLFPGQLPRPGLWEGRE